MHDDDEPLRVCGVFIFVGESLLEFGRQLSDHRRLAWFVFSSTKYFIYGESAHFQFFNYSKGQLDFKHFEVVVAVVVDRPTMHTGPFPMHFFFESSSMDAS